jgi:hypothetical protein
MVIHIISGLKLKLRSSVFSLLLLFILAVPSLAAEFTNDLDEFLLENPGVTLQRFNDVTVTPGTFLSCVSPINFLRNDACFTPGFIAPGIEFFVNQLVGVSAFTLVGSNFLNQGNPPNVLSTAFNIATIDIEFPSRQARVVGFNAGCLENDAEGCADQMTVEVFGTGPEPIGTTVINVGSDFDTFLGIEYTEPISRITLTLSPGSFAFPGIERVWFELGPATTAIPTLSEWGMIAAAAGFAAIGMLYAVRKRRARA